MNDVPPDKFDKTNEINELQRNEIFSKINENLGEEISTIRKEVAQLNQIVGENYEKVNKQNNATYTLSLLNQLCNITSYLTIAAVVIIAILIALLVQSQQNVTELKQQVAIIQEILRKAEGQLNSLQAKLDEDITQNITELKQQNTRLQQVLNGITAYQQYQFKLDNSAWSAYLWLSSEMTNLLAPVIVKMPSFNRKVTDREVWSSNPFFAFGGGYQMCLKVYVAGRGNGEGTHISVYLYLMKGPHDDKL